MDEKNIVAYGNMLPDPGRNEDERTESRENGGGVIGNAMRRAIAEGIQRHSLAGLPAAAIHGRRRADGVPLIQVLCALLIWPLLKVESIHCFCAQLCQVLSGKVSVLRDFLGREDVNWRGMSSELV